MIMEELEDNLYDAVEAVLPLNTQIIYANQDTPEPSGVHLTIRPIHLNPVGGVYRGTLIDKAGVERVATLQNYEYYVQFSTTGKGSGSLLVELCGAIELPFKQDEFFDRDISFLRKTYIRRVPDRREDAYVEAYNFEMFFLVCIETSIDDGYTTDTVEYVHIIDTIN